MDVSPNAHQMSLMRKHVDHPQYFLCTLFFRHTSSILAQRLNLDLEKENQPIHFWIFGDSLLWISIIPNKLGSITLNQLTIHIKSSIFSYIMYA